MPFRGILVDPFRTGAQTGRSLLLVALPSAVTGSACALFLWSLTEVSVLFWRVPNLLWGLPLAGIVVTWLYRKFGSVAAGGNSLIIDQIHQPGDGVPLRMAPLILVTTLLTHLCGGSAGREGTAVQMGGSISSGFARLYRRWSVLGHESSDLRLLLMAGIAAGFSGVFGTPLAGAIFALEVLTLGRLSYEALVPCVFAALVGDWVCSAWGVGHTHYSVASLPKVPGASAIDWWLLGQVAVAAIGFGVVSACFSKLTHAISKLSRRLISNAYLRPVLGAIVVILLTFWLGRRDYLGLGVTAPNTDDVTISSCFQAGGATTWSWLWKLLFTAVTLGSGFKGGEVTPLFFIGAALGNTMALLLGAPVDLLAAVGFVAVFAGATNTPLACTVLAIELFGSDHAIYYAVGCLVAYLASGHSGIYDSQRIGEPKSSRWLADGGKTIGDVSGSG